MVGVIILSMTMITPPSEKRYDDVALVQVIRIFDSILSPKLAEFDGEIKPLAAHIAQATLRVSEADGDF